MANPLYDKLFAPHEKREARFLHLPGGGSLSYATFLNRSAQMAQALTKCGVAPGDRVAVHIHKSSEALALYAACVKAGAVFLPLNTAYTPAELDYFVGDSGYHEEYFKQIGERLGPFRLAMIPIGAYAPRYFMGSAHIDPAQAVDVHLEVRAQQSLPVHWGTFQLTIEPILEPPALLRAETARRGLPPDAFRPARIGETLVLP